VVDPGRSIARATIWGTICVGLLYLALNVVYFCAIPVAEMASAPVEPVAQKSAVALFGVAAGRLVTVMLCISIPGATSAMIWAGPRVYYAMACDGVLPSAIAKVRESGGAPARSIVLQSGWVTLLVLVGGFEALVVYSGFVLIAFTACAAGAVIVLRRKRPDIDRPYRTSLYPLAPVLYVAVSVLIMWAALKLRPLESLLGVLTVTAGVPLYFFWKRRISS
jgi:APA family basic amino acid/polyamine antiporter